VTTLDLLRRRLDGTFEVDPFGLDTDVVELLAPAMAVRWSVDVSGAEHIPPEGAAVLVHNRRFGLSEAAVLTHAVRIGADRWLRPVGAPDLAVVGPAVRRLGAVLDDPAEMASVLRAGHVVALGLRPQPRHRHRAGTLHPEALTCAVDLDVPVLPVAVTGRELGRRWRIVVGEPLPSPSGRGPLAVAELADRVRAGVQELLDDTYPPRLFRR
jgi:hypothetical protein